MAKKKQADTLVDIHTFPSILMRGAMITYTFLMFGLFPLYYQNRYFNMGEAKYAFYKYATIIMIAFMTVVGLLSFIVNLKSISWKNLYKKISLLDGFVIAYAVSLIISFALSPYKEDALYGYSGWGMGLIAQLSFVVIYFFVSRYYKWMSDFLYIALGVSAIVFLLGILHRFLIDPLAMYEGVAPNEFTLFLSTLGQATWFSSYLCILFPIGLFLYWSCENTKFLPWLGAYVAIGSASWVTQNSDSAFFALPVVLLILFCCSFHDNKRFLRFWEIIIIALSSMRLIGILQMLFPNDIVKLDTLSIFASQHFILWPILILVILFYLFLRMQEKKQTFMIERFLLGRNIIISIAVVSVPLIFLLIVLTTKQMLPQALSFLYNIDYFNFNESWGNNRGYNWSFAWSIFQEMNPLKKLFGVGPDSFAFYSYNFHSAFLSQKWQNDILSNAHNEWLNTLVTLGITGLAAYLGVFITGIVTFLKKSRDNLIYILFALCIAAYVTHNLFCYQQVICTPLIFILIGMGSIKELPVLWSKN